MQYAVTREGVRVQAVREVGAVCPNCGEQVLAKCGRIRVHHWSHVAGKDCDAWYEPETLWHRNWKREFPEEWVELAMGEHRADVRCPSGLVVELQHSAISPDEIQAREKFYGRMVWIVNAAEFEHNFFLMRLMNGKSPMLTFRWKHPRTSWMFARRPVFFDFGATPVGALLGAKAFEVGGFLQAVSHPDFRPAERIVRLTEAKEGRDIVDPSIEALGDLLLGCTLLRKQTLYAKGWGAAAPVSRAEVLALCH